MTEKKDIVVWGTSGFAAKIADIIRLSGKYRIIGFLDDRENAQKGSPFCGAEILGGREVLQSLINKGVSELAFAFGNCHAKVDLSLKTRKLGFNLPVIVHDSAIIADSARLGDGTIVGAGAVVEPGCVIGDCVFINTRATIGHDGTIGDYNHIGPGVTIAGNTTVGSISRIGVGATVIDGIKIGSGSFIGAGSLVVKDIPDQVVAFGSPAKIIRKSDGKF